MKRGIIFPVLISCWLFSCGTNKVDNKKVIPTDTISLQQPSSIKPGLIEGTEIFTVQKNPGIYAMGRIGDTLIYCSKKGEIEIADTNNRIRHQIIDLKVPMLIDEIYVIPLSENKWFFVWQETFQEGVRSYAALYESGSSKPEWKILFSVPNPGRPVVDGNHAYVSALGVVGKISLNDGSFIWKHDSLFNKSKFPFQKIEKALVYPDKVIFIDQPVHGIREFRDSLILDPISGNRKK